MRLLLVLLLCLHNINAITLTYPIKGAFVGYEAKIWGDPGQHIKKAADSGYNMVIMSFFAQTALEMVEAWDSTSDSSKGEYINYAHDKGLAILLGVRIVPRYMTIPANATEYGITVANEVKKRNYDGVDIFIRDTAKGFSIGTMDSATSISWVIELTQTIRNLLGEEAIITYSPLARDFGPLNANTDVGPLGGFTSIHRNISTLIQHYNIFYFSYGSSQCFGDYNGIFVSSDGCPYASVSEISLYANIPINKIVVTKPIQLRDDNVTQFLNTSQLHYALSAAKSVLQWDAGVVGWAWDDEELASSAWISSIYPLETINVTGPPTSSPSPRPPTRPPSPSPSTPSPSPSLSPNSTSPPHSSTSLSSTSGDHVNTECPNGQVYDPASQACKPKKKNSNLAVAIVIPIVIVFIVALVIAFFLVKRNRDRQSSQNKLERLPSKSLSLPDLSDTYHNSNLITEYGAIVIKKRLGQGGSGVVNLGVWSHIEVAVKEFSNQDIQTTDFIRESEIHAKLRHPNIVQLLAICLPPNMCTISEFMAKGSLADVLEQKLTQFTWKRKLQALHDIAKGMDYLHQSKIIHRDLKSQNVLVDKNWICKIADFGTSKLVSEANATATAYVPRTAQWSAPEVIVRGEYSEKSDVYSFGVIMWECYTGNIPYDGMFAFQVEDRTVRGSRLTIPVGCEAWYEALMQECWAPEPENRPLFETIIAAVDRAVQTK